MATDVTCSTFYCNSCDCSSWLPMLFQMPEEQAFCVLVKIMYEYGLRALYKNNFEDLHCKFYQLERLMQVIDKILYNVWNAIECIKNQCNGQWHKAERMTLTEMRHRLQVVPSFFMDLCFLIIHGTFSQTPLAILYLKKWFISQCSGRNLNNSALGSATITGQNKTSEFLSTPSF